MPGNLIETIVVRVLRLNAKQQVATRLIWLWAIHIITFLNAHHGGPAGAEAVASFAKPVMVVERLITGDSLHDKCSAFGSVASSGGSGLNKFTFSLERAMSDAIPQF